MGNEFDFLKNKDLVDALRSGGEEINNLKNQDWTVFVENGAIKVVMNGNLHIESITIDPDYAGTHTAAELGKVLTQAINQCYDQIQQQVNDINQKMMSNLRNIGFAAQSGFDGDDKDDGQENK